MADGESGPSAAAVATASSSSSSSSSSRNFRSSYYEKLGFCGNEEKNLLESLLTANPFDMDKLNDHLRERLDLDRRCVDAWKILLGVECGRKNPFEECTNIKRIRGEHFISLKHHLEVLLKHNVVMRDRLNKQRAVSNNKSTGNTTTTTVENQRPATNKDNDHHRAYQSNLPVDPSSSNHIHSGSDLQHDMQKSSFSDLPNRSNANSSMIEEKIEPHEHIAPVGRENRNENIREELMGNQISNGKCQNFELDPKKLLDDIKAYPCKQITLMYLLEAGRLDSSDIDAQLSSPQIRRLSALALFFVNVANDLQEAFFLFRNLTKKVEEAEAKANTATQASVAS